MYMLSLQNIHTISEEERKEEKPLASISILQVYEQPNNPLH